MIIGMDDGAIVVSRPTDERRHRSLHGLTRTLIANMVIGVSEGFTKNLEIVGVGYRAVLKGADLDMSLGFSHPVIVVAEPGITFEVPVPTKITVSGIDKQRVGQVAAEIRKLRPPEPYKGKGVRYAGEKVRRKLGKAAK
jgi:large subunit ribosomal protein L6